MIVRDLLDIEYPLKTRATGEWTDVHKEEWAGQQNCSSGDSKQIFNKKNFSRFFACLMTHLVIAIIIGGYV